MPNKDKAIAAAQNRKGQATWRKKVKTEQERKRHILAQWKEHNVIHWAKQEDGGFRISLEHTPEGDRITAEFAELCGMDPDTFVQTMVGETLVEMGGKWMPTKPVKRAGEE